MRAETAKNKRGRRTKKTKKKQENLDQLADKTEAPAINIEPDAAEDHTEFSPHMLSDVFDRSLHAAVAKFTKGQSPAALANAYTDWALHMASSPGRQMELVQDGLNKWMQLMNYAVRSNTDGEAAEPCVTPEPGDRRFKHEGWNSFPFNFYQQAFLLNQQWWRNAATDVRGVSRKHEDIVDFSARQILDIFSPSNFLPTNPELIEKTREEMGMNLVRGFQNFMEDLERTTSSEEPAGLEEFKVGEKLAATPGKVVYRNRMMELIQYEPATEKVRREPILITPAWIMKYYILDLSPYNSLVKYLTEQGYTVFMISWLNPGAEDRELGMDDYQRDGVLSAINVVSSIVPNRKIHAVGYCLGGTLLAITAATLARENNNILKSLTFFAAQVDFKEAGELTLFVSESQLSFLEDMMWESGYLDSSQMAGTFQALRSNDLIWSKMLHDYVMGNRQKLNDLMAWNADPTRMPYKMHSQYLRKLFLDNDLSQGRYKVGDRVIALKDIQSPTFCVGTVKDHIAPWKSVFKFHLLLDADVTFVLTSGGHNAGIVSEPGHRGRTYRIRTQKHGDNYMPPKRWEKETPLQEGSWWPEWVEWLNEQSGKTLVNQPSTGNTQHKPICDAPGTYIFQK